MSELKIILDLSDQAREALDKLIGAVDDLSTSQICADGSFKDYIEAKKKKQVPTQATTAKKAEAPVEQKAEPKAEAVDYEKWRAEIRAVASAKKVAGKDVKAVLKAYGGRLSEVADDRLTALRDEMEAL